MNDQLTKEIEKEIKDADLMLAGVSGITVSSAEGYTIAADKLKELKKRYKTLDDKRKEATKPLDESKKLIISWFTPPLDNLKLAIDRITGGMLDWNAKIERERAEAEAKARAKEEAERAKIQERIDKAADKGDIAKVEALQQKQEAVQVAVVAPVVEKQAGLAVTETWVGVVEDFSKMPDEVMGMKIKVVDQGELNRIGKMSHGTAIITGVRWVSKQGIRGVRS